MRKVTAVSYTHLDVYKRQALRGEESFGKVVDMAEYARSEINSIGGYYAYGKELVNGNPEPCLLYTSAHDPDRSAAARDLHGSRF